MSSEPIFWHEIVGDLTLGRSLPEYLTPGKWTKRKRRRRGAKAGEEIRQYETCAGWERPDAGDRSGG